MSDTADVDDERGLRDEASEQARKRALYSKAALAQSVVPAGVADELNRSRRLSRERRRHALQQLRHAPLRVKLRAGLWFTVWAAWMIALVMGVLTKDGVLLLAVMLVVAAMCFAGIALEVWKAVRASRRPDRCPHGNR